MAKTSKQIYDQLLVLKSQAGDRQAFEELVSRWQPRLWRHAYQLTESRDAAWDVVQDSWAHIIRGMWRLQDAAAFPCWAFRIVSNKSADWVRKEQRRRWVSEELAQDTRERETGADGSPEGCDSLREALKRLPGDRRALLSLRYVEEFSIGEIAETLSIPEGTVKSRLHQARLELKQLMEKGSNE